ncbi:MAG: rRNA maturation RNase YbeY [Actinobacteria bacterium]|nr:rRNA maturation RNase YbeY [Actinomycetota bacterium]NIS35959.1 rRNA maturation RNase YbeY [Actinomycetota bacterium]NIT98450.1 rRNA maturation RNase YbeY [Actinomycetota bacterium]NIU22059.1 rRNA maturation RNase YbeY [Actinomycetota bacterium]NIU70553.1 rRNA maturation RNase YbeY [Actinomycetota bacterium]
MSDRPLVVVVDSQRELPVDADRWGRLAADALVACGVTAGELNLLFVDEEEMTGFNREHMGVDGPTDVLSFPLDGAGGAEVGESLIGDVVVCPAYAARQAPDHGGRAGHDGSVDDELALLVVHGVLHVLGHDHVDEDETAVMQQREQELLAAHHRP